MPFAGTAVNQICDLKVISRGNSRALERLHKKVKVSYAFREPAKISLPQNDIPILAGALGFECTHLWTSDKKHFGKWYGKKVQGVSVVSSILLADLLITRGWDS